MHAGKPQKQSLAIAYAMKRKAQGKKMADGGEVDEYGYPKNPQGEKPLYDVSGYEKHAHGGEVGEHHDYDFPDVKHEREEMASGYVSHEGAGAKANHKAMMEDDRMLNQHGEDEVGPMGSYAAGGFIGSHGTEEHEMDMVGRILKHQGHCYSEGGKIANGGEDDLERMADGRPNNFDDLALRDDLEFNYTADNSGDELSDKQEDHDRADMVARILKQKRMKPRGMPGSEKPGL